MKNAVIYVIGFIPLAIVSILILSADIIATPAGLALGYAIYRIAHTSIGSKFWSSWLQINDRLNNAIAPRRKDGAK